MLFSELDRFRAPFVFMSFHISLTCLEAVFKGVPTPKAEAETAMMATRRATRADFIMVLIVVEWNVYVLEDFGDVSNNSFLR